MTLASLLPSWLYGQDASKEKASEGKYEWNVKELKEAGEHLEEMNAWQAAINEYEREESERERLDRIASETESQRDKLQDQLSKVQGMLQDLCSDRTERDWFKRMYERYDTTLLIQLKGHFGNEESEQIVDDLLACHRAEALLSVPYDEARVIRASKKLHEMEGNDKAGLNYSIASQLDRYREMTANLRDVLLAAKNDEVVKKAEQEPNSSSVLIERARESFFRVIEGKEDGIQVKLAPSLLDPKVYPYLYGILMEAMETKYADPGKKIDDLIEKL